MAGAGGAGVGGWQIYEEVNPTVDKQLSREGYSYSPISFPKEEDPINEKLNWTNWECMQKLFPEITINQKDPTPIADSLIRDANLLNAPQVTDDLVVCAMMDIRPITLDEQYPNRIYFRSEVVVKDGDYGWVMWTGLSAVRGTNTNIVNNNDINFEYRLILLKKDGGVWKETGGYSWHNYFHDSDTAEFVIKTPFEEWLEKVSKSSVNIRKTWTGMAQVDSNKNSENKDLLQSIKIYIDESKYAEFFGNDGNFLATPGAGFTDVSEIYVTDGNDKGWRKVSDSSKHKDLSSSLKTWYAPFKEKKLKWMNLEEIQSQCYDWSKNRNLKMFGENKVWQDICYNKKLVTF